MKAVVYEGPRQVSVKDVPDAKIERPTDVLVQITSANINLVRTGPTGLCSPRWFGCCPRGCGHTGWSPRARSCAGIGAPGSREVDLSTIHTGSGVHPLTRRSPG
ncbi:hypothetical protein [Amycolatopsis sp. NPDC021455]|uniref:hypothetical protein n=1 Tax=Amycolatopsis sp. NPDC021455 TaxID=3154901 RepID=UPI0033D649B5